MAEDTKTASSSNVKAVDIVIGHAMIDVSSNSARHPTAGQTLPSNSEAEIMKTLFKDDEQGTWLVPPRIQSMICGVTRVFVIHPRYRLVYADGTTEDAILDDALRGADIFKLTSAVQAKRITEGGK